MAQETNAEVIRTVKGKAAAEPESVEKKKIRAAAYCRVSTLSEEQECSLETQKRAYEVKITEDPDLELAGIYSDRGISGGSIKKRLGFQKMMQDCRDGKIDLVMTKSISRFARNLADTLECIRELKGLGIPVHFDKEGIDTMDPASDMTLGMLAAVAQEEINNMSQNIKWALEKSSSQGNPKTPACYGYRKFMDGEKCVWKICEPEKERLQLAFDMADRGERYWKILRALQKMEDEDGTGILWSQQLLLRYLRNITYTGDLISGKTVTVDCLHGKTIKNNGEYPMYYLEGHHEAIVPREQFEQVQEKIKSKELSADRYEAIPERYRNGEWKKRYGIKVENKNGEIYNQLRGCCSNGAKGELKDGEKCLYGRCRCYNCEGCGQ